MTKETRQNRQTYVGVVFKIPDVVENVMRSFLASGIVKVIPEGHFAEVGLRNSTSIADCHCIALLVMPYHYDCLSYGVND